MIKEETNDHQDKILICETSQESMAHEPHKIIDEIMFYILERAKCEEDTNKYLEHIRNYCKKDYEQSYRKQNKIELRMDEIRQKFNNHKKKINHL